MENNQNTPTQQALQEHFQSVQNLIQSFTEELYESYDQELTSNIDNPDQALSQAKNVAESKIESFHQKLNKANHDFRKKLEEASLESDDQAIKSLEDQIENL